MHFRPSISKKFYPSEWNAKRMFPLHKHRYLIMNNIHPEHLPNLSYKWCKCRLSWQISEYHDVLVMYCMHNILKSAQQKLILLMMHLTWLLFVCVCYLNCLWCTPRLGTRFSLNAFEENTGEAFRLV